MHTIYTAYTHAHIRRHTYTHTYRILHALKPLVLYTVLSVSVVLTVLRVSVILTVKRYLSRLYNAQHPAVTTAASSGNLFIMPTATVTPPVATMAAAMGGLPLARLNIPTV